MNENLEKIHLNLTKAKLEEARPLIKLFGLDYDGTVSDGANYQVPQVFALVERILTKDKSVAFITARAATALKNLAPPLQELLVRRDTFIPNFIAGGNGTTLYEVKKDELIEIYNHGLDLSEIKGTVDAWRKIYEKFGLNVADLTAKGLETFKRFLQEDWDNYIPSEIVDVCRPYKGEVFTEEAKVTFVLPRNKSLCEQVITEVNKELGGRYRVVAGDDTFAHITKQLEEDSKAVAIKTILKSTGLGLTQVATFGDMPEGNDVGLLSFPYSFTNLKEFIKTKKNLEHPPYVLIEPNLTAVAQVYKAIDYLLS